jgi:hypothetical protein
MRCSVSRSFLDVFLLSFFSPLKGVIHSAERKDTMPITVETGMCLETVEGWSGQNGSERWVMKYDVLTLSLFRLYLQSLSLSLAPLRSCPLH